jgi:hypothetical protein
MCASKDLKCQPEYCDSGTPTPPTNMYLLKRMEKPLLVNFPCQQYLRTMGKSKKRRITKNHSPTSADPQIQFPTPQIFQDPPTFHTIIPRYHPHTAYNTLPSKIRYQHIVEPFEILSLFLTQSLLEDMAANTNAYAAAKARER